MPVSLQGNNYLVFCVDELSRILLVAKFRKTFAAFILICQHKTLQFVNKTFWNEAEKFTWMKAVSKNLLILLGT